MRKRFLAAAKLGWWLGVALGGFLYLSYIIFVR